MKRLVEDGSMSKSFIDSCLSGDALLDEIDDWVERWHGNPSKQTLSHWLGMGKDEYAAWLEEPSAIRLIVAARKSGRDLQDLLTSNEEMLIAARAEDPMLASRVLEWLRQTNRI